MIKYGVKNVLQVESVRKKSEQNYLNKYGVNHPMLLDATKNKIKKTNLNKYGDEVYFKTTSFKIKSKITNLRKYCVEYSTQNEEIYNRAMKNSLRMCKYKDSNLYYQGTYELDFLNNYFHIGVERGKSIKYFLNDNEKIYFPDFYYKSLNLIIEIKSEYTYNLHLEKNIEKEKACLEQGFNYIKIIDKNYLEFDELIKSL